ncbi:hypothetical protein [Azospirillum argentinense]
MGQTTNTRSPVPSRASQTSLPLWTGSPRVPIVRSRDFTGRRRRRDANGIGANGIGRFHPCRRPHRHSGAGGEG